jgi:hypothetical protein
VNVPCLRRLSLYSRSSTGSAITVPVNDLENLLCQVCRGELKDDYWCCPECAAPTHTECHREIGGCTRFGCPEAATPQKRLLTLLTESKQTRLTTAKWLAVSVALILPLVGLKLTYVVFKGSFFGLGCIGVVVSESRALYRLRNGHVSLDELLSWLVGLREERKRISDEGGSPSEPVSPRTATWRAILVAAFGGWLAWATGWAWFAVAMLPVAIATFCMSRNPSLLNFEPSRPLVTSEIAWMIDAWGPELEELVKRPELAQITAADYTASGKAKAKGTNPKGADPF